MNFIQKLALRYLGPTFFSRASGTLVAAFVAYLAKIGVIIPEDTISQFTESSQVILSLVIGSLVGITVDMNYSKKDKK